ncbi:YdcF family protein [Aneurinibacillus danicus]|uniref:DUF218 domain-containing protein n=1 Tax=Aneurinibacillus danicus TaxID=267746 RepID=A0A511V5G8_9BACL|nr:YdcF family protein [Aneurinibacillus danicus]GEN34184.1 hypothetical protein ADA01nite_16440 [Aneurinibacillus danicus]
MNVESRLEKHRLKKRTRRKKLMRLLTSFFFLLIIVVVGCFIYSEKILTYIGGNLVVKNQIKKADAIVVFGGGEKLERLNHAITLYQQGYAPKIVLSGGISKSPDSFNWAKSMKEYGMRKGVPAGVFIVDDRAESTYDNALHTIDIFRKEGFSTGILVTSPYHTKRSLWTLKQIEKESRVKLEWVLSPTTESSFYIQNWWKNKMVRSFVIEEYVKLVAYKLIY